MPTTSRAMTLAVITETPSLDPRLTWAFVDFYSENGVKIDEAIKCDTRKKVSALLGETLRGARIVEPVEIEFLRAVNSFS